MHWKRRIIQNLQAYAILYIVVAGIAVGVAGFSLFRDRAPEEQTLTVHPAEFLQQVSVSGKVVAAQDVDLGFSQSGRVSYIRGKVGESVVAGTVLAEIENGDLRATVLQRRAALASQQAKLDALKAGTRPEDIAVAQSSVDGAESAVAQANQDIVNAIRDAYAKSDDAVHNQLDQFIINPRTTSAQFGLTTTALQLSYDIPPERITMEQTLLAWQSELSVLTSSSDLGVATANAQSNLSSVAKLLADASVALAQAVPSPSVSQSTITSYISDIATARTTINTSIASLNAALSAQKAAVSSLNTARKNLALKTAGATATDIAAQAALVQAAQADLENAQAQLTKTRIVAPFSGIITRFDTKVGEIVSPNVPEISVIGAGTFQIESFIPEANVALIRVDDPAKVTLDAYGDETVFDAKVVSVDPAETIRDGVSTYRAVLQFAAQDSRIKSGMTANAVITTEDRSGVIAVPQGAVTMRNGKKFVSVKSGEQSIEREVETGEVSSFGTIEITSGLSDGDTIALPALR